MNGKTLINTLRSWLSLKTWASVDDSVKPPISAELFSIDQMEHHGVALALSHTLTQKLSKDIFLRQLAASEATLIKSCDILAEKIDSFSPAQEWLLDNFYLIQEEIHSIRRNLPKGYGRGLPQLAGRISGYPRIYDITREIIEHSDGHWDLENLSCFISAYQTVTPLTLGELWAIPITLGVALIENLSKVSKQILADRLDRKLASHWADRMVDVASSEPKKLVIIIAEMARSALSMNSVFVAELVRRLQGAALALPLSWIEQRLAEDDLTIEQLVHEENIGQAANQVTVSNSIASLRRLGEVNWRDFVESMSILHKTLQKDPSATYNQMDFDTRDRYRHVVEDLVRISKRSEEEVALCAVELAKAKTRDKTNPMTARECHVGFYLIGAGLSQLEQALEIRRFFWKKVCRFISQWALLIYMGCVTLITSGLCYALLFQANQSGLSNVWLWVMGIVIAVYGSQLAVALTNLGATLLVKPQPLPRMDFSKGIPAEWRTLVVIPAMLSSAREIESLVERLEVHFLGNRDEHLHFMLLTDFNDAPAEHMPEDSTLLALAKEKITALNLHYPRKDSDIFFLCHRLRQWNASENIWMGKERKRGKLMDLNNLLRKNIKTSFSAIVGGIDVLSCVKYVITLDSDTQLPRDSACQFVGTMVHPLNRPSLDTARQSVVDGYGILQPRMAEAFPLSGPTRYLRLCSNEFGIDPYTRTVSDLYQDLFHEGSFMGKGIYDVDLFQQVLEKRFPDNRILSHDLLEGCYLRSGFLSDLPLYEKSPSSYLSDVKRRTRWIRGDWQIAAWLLPSVLNGDNVRVANPLSFLSKLKLFDNLRRSLVPVALLVLLGFSLICLPTLYFWLTSVLAMVILPTVINILLELMRKPQDVLLSQYAVSIFHVASRQIKQLIFYLACLPHEACVNLGAISRTCWRLMVSKRHLLEWTPSEQMNQRLRDTALEWIANMWMGPAATVIVVVVLLIQDRFNSLLFALPLLALWLLSPLIAYWVSRPFHRRPSRLDAVQIRFLRKTARVTWRFFDTFVTAEEHWLPPDNYQQAPVEALARRTSPTNIGLSLLANLTAYDFGYINMSQLLTRTMNALQTIASLERYHGHLYNWYSTETLAPLLPRYISTVDNGNLVGHLLTLRQGLLALSSVPLLNMRYLDGLEDTWNVLVTEVIPSQPPALSHFQHLLDEARLSFASWLEALAYSNKLCTEAEKIVALLGQSETENELSEWLNKLLLQCYALRDEIALFAQAPELAANASLRDIALMASTDATIAAQKEANRRIALIDTLAEQTFSLAQMDFSFLYDEGSHLLAIGFNVDGQRRDASSYDLLSSEARLASFVAIAQGQVRQESWFALGRLLVANRGEPILVSWSGSMFEYLMPLLVMPNYPGTLLDQTYHAVIRAQIAYGKQRGVPWGISESGYSAVDTQFNYLYRAFGVPGLGLKRGLEEDLVIAPYASAMALMIAPEEACQNLQLLAKEHTMGKFGFYEAIDFTLARLPPDSEKVLVRSFMTHHQGMSLLAFSYLLHDQPMQKRFVAEPLFQATLLLLQERTPKLTAIYLQIPKSPSDSTSSQHKEASTRVFNSPNSRTPQVQLLSNGHYHLVLTQAGGGYSRFKDIALTRWREDSTCDDWGLFSYVRDLATGEFWSTNYQPTSGAVENFRAVFSETQVEFNRNDKRLDLNTKVVVSPEDDIELRRLHMHNRSRVRRTIELTSYGEIVLAPQTADLAQPAFSNLFVKTELLPEKRAILATRRANDGQENSPWLCHLLNVYSESPFTLSFETDRARFIGRGHSLAAPRAMIEKGDLSNTQGAVLDPIIAIRCRLTLEPDALVTFDLLTGVANSRSQCIALVEKYQDHNLTNRIFELAWTHGQALLHHLNISAENAQLYGRLASAIIYASNTRRGDPQILASNRRGQSSLWSYSISGDLPIVLLYIEDAANIELAQQLIQAQAYCRSKGLLIDLVILNEEKPSYRQALQDLIMNLTTRNTAKDNTGNIVVRPIKDLSSEDLILLQSVARVILSDKRGTLKEQLSRRRLNPPIIPLLKFNKLPPHVVSQKLAELPKDLKFFNGLGGFTALGNEYLISLAEGASTPAPWVNVLANPNFGTLVSESGQGYTWVENSHEFRLTPWDNDPLKDSSGEAFYLRDDETGLVWSPTALPCRGCGDYRIRHGFGYTVFEHIEDGIHSELWIYVALDASVKFSVLKIRNDSKRSRQLSVTGYVAWVLGDLRTTNLMHVVTELSQNGALLAENHYNTAFGERTAFFSLATTHLELTSRTVTGDRTEFLGRNGSQGQPAALKRKRLSGRVGAGLDPCSAIQVTFNLAEGRERNIVFTLGAGQNREDANTLIQKYHGKHAAEMALAATQQHWQKILSKVQITTPDETVNLLANGWLLYQVLSSRLWGRTGYYQSSGAFGFRDQLQDVMSLSQVAPELFRAHILLCAAHQFEEGDVQHWWHPPQNRGVRTRCSDDYLWLAFAICHYIETTGDEALLDEKVSFLQGRPLHEHEESYYELPTTSSKAESLYQHAVSAIKYGLKFGVHGLPLMGSGDWNDGMNLVGKEGRGESVWLGFFLYSVLQHFAPIASRYGDHAFALRCDEEKNKLQRQIEAHGWDGQWYRRAYFDDGTPLGSSSNSECRIDSIAQSWSVLSGAASPLHAKQAMSAVESHLINKSDRLVKLLAPPFENFVPNPGYIEGYVAGIRENGGQYTHGAVWVAMAFAQLGEKSLAWELLSILNPINHGRCPAEIELYKIEPYVIAGDVYSVAPHIGHGGWSWYTGSAGWLYRLITETLLGIRLEEGKALRLTPLLPDDWEGFSLDYNYGNTLYKMTINGVKEKGGIQLDGVALDGNVMPLLDDNQVHHVTINILR